ncbi:MAG TPA: MoxR family ATPase [Candidatus Acidoferrales bacterium]|nr:MoxR family ATPase [Candidatus Acidoferrales bacterium]
MFASVDDVVARLAEQNYLCSRGAATVVFLAATLQKPLLVEGPAGVGKTELAKVIARSLGVELIRLQCYEGLDEAKALYEWEYTKQLLYTQILKEKIGALLADTTSLREAVERIAREDNVFFSETFLLARPLLRAIRAQAPTVLLIDEVDKSDTEFEAFLLEVLSDFQISVPEIGTLKAEHIPLAILTSNSSREISDALKRRCLHLYLNFPDVETEIGIVKLKVPDADLKLVGEAVQLVKRLRSLDLKKTPSISETLDWVRALAALNVRELTAPEVEETLSALVKTEKDLEKAREELKRFIALLSASPQPGRSSRDRDLLH